MNQRRELTQLKDIQNELQVFINDDSRHELKIVFSYETTCFNIAEMKRLIETAVHYCQLKSIDYPIIVHGNSKWDNSKLSVSTRKETYRVASALTLPDINTTRMRGIGYNDEDYDNEKWYFTKDEVYNMIMKKGIHIFTCSAWFELDELKERMKTINFSIDDNKCIFIYGIFESRQLPCSELEGLLKESSFIRITKECCCNRLSFSKYENHFNDNFIPSK